MATSASVAAAHRRPRPTGGGARRATRLLRVFPPVAFASTRSTKPGRGSGTGISRNPARKFSRSSTTFGSHWVSEGLHVGAGEFVPSVNNARRRCRARCRRDFAVPSGTSMMVRHFFETVPLDFVQRQHHAVLLVQTGPRRRDSLALERLFSENLGIRALDPRRRSLRRRPRVPRPSSRCGPRTAPVSDARGAASRRRSGTSRAPPRAAGCSISRSRGSSVYRRVSVSCTRSSAWSTSPVQR